MLKKVGRSSITPTERLFCLTNAYLELAVIAVLAGEKPGQAIRYRFRPGTAC